MKIEDLLTIIKDLGFPMFVAIWFMYRLERRMDKISETLSSLMHSTASLAKAVDGVDESVEELREITGQHQLSPKEARK